MRDDRYIARKFGKDNHFRVPDGYFNDLEKQVMSEISDIPSEQKAVISSRKKSVLRTLIPYSAAACIVAAIAGATVYLSTSDKSTTSIGNSTAQYYSQDVEMDMMADYAMLSSDDFYRYMSEEISSK